MRSFSFRGISSHKLEGGRELFTTFKTVLLVCSTSMSSALGIGVLGPRPCHFYFLKQIYWSGPAIYASIVTCQTIKITVGSWKAPVERQGFSLCGCGAFGHKPIWDNCGFNIASSKTIVSISMGKKIHFSQASGPAVLCRKQHGPNGLI